MNFFKVNLLYGGAEIVCKANESLYRGCPHITSANFRGFQAPPPPLVSLRQHLADPPSITAFKENTLFDMK